MAILADDSVIKHGTRDTVTTGTPAAITDGSFGKANQAGSAEWTNDDNAPLASAILSAAFAVSVTIGSIGLYARLIDIDGTNHTAEPDSDYPHYFLGSFPIDFGAGTSTFRTAIPKFEMPQTENDQQIDFYLKNEGTGQTLSASWALFITPITEGPAA